MHERWYFSPSACVYVPSRSSDRGRRHQPAHLCQDDARYTVFTGVNIFRQQPSEAHYIQPVSGAFIHVQLIKVPVAPVTPKKHRM